METINKKNEHKVTPAIEDLASARNPRVDSPLNMKTKDWAELVLKRSKDYEQISTDFNLRYLLDRNVVDTKPIISKAQSMWRSIEKAEKVKPNGRYLDTKSPEAKKLIADEKSGFFKKKLEERLSMLSGSVGIIKVGANSKVELKEKKDRVEDAIYATKAALKEGIVPGGGIALLNASQNIKAEGVGEEILLKAIRSPFETILANAGFEAWGSPDAEGVGVNVITGRECVMIDSGIIDPVLVTKTALKYAVSVVSTIISADCVISNIRLDEGS